MSCLTDSVVDRLRETERTSVMTTGAGGARRALARYFVPIDQMVTVTD